MLPWIIVDKSVLQSLRNEEVEELGNCFTLLCVPTLMREIIADLRKKQSRSQRSTAEQRVQNLAMRVRKMRIWTPSNFRSCTIADLAEHSIPMTGQIPVRNTTANIFSSGDGKGVMYDGTMEQRIWDKWARGEFSTDDHDVATMWRESLDQVDMEALRQTWKGFIRTYMAEARTVEEITARVDALLASPDREIQTYLIAVVTRFVRAPEHALMRPAYELVRRPGTTILQIAPYAASVLRLYLVFIAATVKELLPLRPSNAVDLHYLLYVPFTNFGLASSDVLHQRLWPATTTRAMFIPGDELRHDLANRVQWRADLEQRSQEERDAHYREYAFYPVELPDSIVNRVYDHGGYMPRERFMESRRERPPLSEVDAKVSPDLRRMIDEFERLRQQKKPSAEWPYGPDAGDESAGL